MAKKEDLSTTKFKLTKEQKQYVDDFVTPENRISKCREFIQLWMNFFRFFADDLEHKEITAQEEKEFFSIQGKLARRHFMFVELMADKFERGNDVLNVLTLAVSLSNIQQMEENTRGKLELDWHSLLLDMNKTLGRIVRDLPGNMTLSEALAELDKGGASGLSAASKDKNRGKEKKGDKPKVAPPAS